MKAIIFKGRKFAEGKEKELKKKVSLLKKGGINLKLVSILVGENKASKLFLSLKRKAATRVGIEHEIEKFAKDVSLNNIHSFIKKANKDKKVNGIMIQLPLPKTFPPKKRDELLGVISKDKDVDGMREGSNFTTPTVKSVLYILEEAGKHLPVKDGLKVCVVGAKGFVGKRIFSTLKDMGYEIKGIDIGTRDLKKNILNTDILISSTGKPGLIKKNMVKKGAIVIDVGTPKGDVAKGVEEKTSYLSKVPGGVGPVTIVSLLENIVEPVFV